MAKKMLKLMFKRKQAGLTQAQLAEKVGLKRMTIYNYEAGIRQPNTEKLVLLANALNCSIDEIVGG